MAAQLLGDGSHVRARADPEIEACDAVSIRDDVERVHTRPAERHLHLDAAPVQAVSALTADVDRGCSRDRQLDLAAEGFEPPRKLVRLRSLRAFDDLALGIVERSEAPEADER